MLDAGVLSAVGPALEALESAIESALATGDHARGDLARGDLTQGARFSSAAAERRSVLKAMKAAEDAAQAARLEKAWSRTPTSMPRAMAEIRAGSPGNVIVVDETITAGPDLFKAFPFAGPNDYYSGRGGGIGQGLAGAIGVAVAQNQRPVLCLSGDGSSMYSIQALWTAAHHDLPIVFVILANREYRVLKHNIDAYRARFNVASTNPYQHMDLTGPSMRFVDLARGMGVAGSQVSRAEDIKSAVASAFASGKPHLVEVEIEGKR